MFGNVSPTVQEIAFQYGRNIGMAFQVLTVALLYIIIIAIDLVNLYHIFSTDTKNNVCS